MKKWDVLIKRKTKNDLPAGKAGKLKIDQIIEVLLDNRGIKTKKEREEFLNPKLEHVSPKSVGINLKQLTKTVERIQKAIENKEKIVVFGDYDVDGICGTAILWETLYGLGADVMPYIPHRIDEGYGLSIRGIDNVILNSCLPAGKVFQDPKNPKEMLNQVQHDTGGLIITVDNGIVAYDAVEYANKNGIDVIITDHHVLGGNVPKAHAIVHTTKLCGTGVAYLLSRVILNSCLPAGKVFQDPKNPKEMLNQVQHDTGGDHLALVALATVADLVPLTGANRTLLKAGLEELKKTRRIGLLALFKEAGIDQSRINTYEIGHIIAPRLNAMGRLEYAMESLRLLCTRDRMRAQVLADTLSRTNKERQVLTEEAVLHALSRIRNQESGIRKLLFIAHESYQPGVIGLVAGKLVEEFYRPSIVLSIGSLYSKASARSIAGFNIIEFIRSASDFLVDAGGHPMAAGFTVETSKIPTLQKRFEELAQKMLDDTQFVRSLRIDCELSFVNVTAVFYKSLQQLAPFGMGNPEPTFVSRNVEIEDMRLIGKERKHLKLRFSYQDILKDGIGFGMGEKANEFTPHDTVDIVYTVDENVWNGNTSLQLKLKDIKKSIN